MSGRAVYILSLASRNRRFAPTLLGTVLLLAGAALFLRLGLWQLERAEDKRALIAQFETGQRATKTVSFEAANSLPRYQRVVAHGRYDSRRQILLENMPSEHGRPGYRVLTPFQLDSGGWLLVDRGWIPMGATRTDMPNVEVDETPRTVIGALDRLPEPGIRLGGGLQEEWAGWPRAFSFPRIEQVESALGLELPRRILLLDDRQPDGYERAWRAPFRVGPGRHISYAVQWFVFALLALILYILMSFRPRSASPEP